MADKGKTEQKEERVPRSSFVPNCCIDNREILRLNCWQTLFIVGIVSFTYSRFASKFFSSRLRGKFHFLAPLFLITLSVWAVIADGENIREEGGGKGALIWSSHWFNKCKLTENGPPPVSLSFPAANITHWIPWKKKRIKEGSWCRIEVPIGFTLLSISPA